MMKSSRFLKYKIFGGFILPAITNEIRTQIKESGHKVLMEVNEFYKSVRWKMFEFLQSVFEILVA